MFRTKRGRPIKEVINTINPMLRGWVNYYRIGNSAKSFNQLKNWVEEKIRRHMQKSRKILGFGWKRWSTEQIYRYSGVYNDYQVRYLKWGKSPHAIGHITFNTKQSRERSAANPHAAFEAAGNGNGKMVRVTWARNWKRWIQTNTNLELYRAIARPYTSAY